MKTWDDWSDLDVSNKITELKNNGDMSRHIKINGLWHFSCSYVVQGIKFADIGGNFKWIPCPHYCNNPLDIWPIIYNNGMSIQAPDEYFDEWHASKLGVNISYCHKNPLRAAAIVFLMMNGVNPE